MPFLGLDNESVLVIFILWPLVNVDMVGSMRAGGYYVDYNQKGDDVYEDMKAGGEDFTFDNDINDDDCDGDNHKDDDDKSFNTMIVYEEVVRL